MWMQQWLYKTKLTVKENDGVERESYPVQINIDATMIDFSVTQSDGADLRFTASDGETILPHWIESFDSDSETAVVHVQMDLAANETKEIYMYYGNTSASDSSTTDVFLWGDDFSEGLSFVPSAGDVTIAGDSGKYEAWPSLARDSSGNLYVVYRTADTNTHLFEPTGRIVMRKSTDGGSTWGSEITVANMTDIDDRNPGMVMFEKSDGGERILIAYNQLSESDCRCAITYSDDYGKTWHTSTNMFTDHCGTRGKIIYSSEGKLLMPFYISDNSDGGAPYSAYVAESSDEGLTWTSYLVASSGWNEWTILETKTGGSYTGSMIGLLRKDDGAYLGIVTSTDYGHTWSSVSDSGIRTNGAAPAELWRDEDTDNIYAFYSDSSGGTIWESTDEGTTWAQKAHFAGNRGVNDPERYYPSVAKIDDDNIGIAWCTNEGWSDVLFTHMPLPITNRWRWLRFAGNTPSVSSSILTMENTSGSDRADMILSTKTDFNGTATPLLLRSKVKMHASQMFGFSHVKANCNPSSADDALAYSRSGQFCCEKDDDNWYVSGVTDNNWMIVEIKWHPTYVDYYENGTLKARKHPYDVSGIPTKDMAFWVYNYYDGNRVDIDWILVKEGVETYPTVTYVGRIRNIPSVRNLGV